MLGRTEITPAFLVQSILLLGGTICLGYIVRQSDFHLIFPAYLAMFIGYVWVLNAESAKLRWKDYLFIAFGLRLILLFAMPGLSDDLFRFIWDGRLLSQGINPFEHLPGYYLESGNEVSGLSAELYGNLNSPEYYTIYPPVAQGIFALATLLFPKSIYGSMVVMKVFLIACEFFTIWLLPRILELLKMPAHHSLVYALNPLMIIEVSGNLHFEGAMVCFFLASLYLILVAQDKYGALSMTLSIASKLLTLMFLPFYIRRMGWNRVIPFYIIVGVTSLIFFLPLFSGVFISHFGESLDLYFRKFEFNASVYYVARWIGFQFSGYNLIANIGPALALISATGILSFAFFHPGDNWKSTLKYMLFGFCLYLAMTTTVHPWYLSLPIILCCFTNYRFPVLWSGLITLTYINYSYETYFENLWVVAFEYGLVALFVLWEVSKYSTARFFWNRPDRLGT